MSALPETRGRGRFANEPALPAGPLLAYLDRFPDAMRGWSNMGNAPGGTPRQQAASRRMVDVRATGWVLFDTAEKICAELEIHPVLLWGDLYWDAAL